MASYGRFRNDSWRGMERGIFHRKFARTHAKARRTSSRNLVRFEEVQRQPLIRAEFITHQIGDNFFVVGPKVRTDARHGRQNAVPDRTVLTTTLLPQVGWLNDWHDYLGIAPALFISSRTMFSTFQDAQAAGSRVYNPEASCGIIPARSISWWLINFRRVGRCSFRV